MPSLLGKIGVACIALIALRSEGPSRAVAEPESTRSAPPDTTPYVRPAIPEDYAPGGRPAISPEVSTESQDATRESPPPDANPESTRNPADTSEERTKITR